MVDISEDNDEKSICNENIWRTGELSKNISKNKMSSK
jgi:hypothetical protein